MLNFEESIPVNLLDQLLHRQHKLKVLRHELVGYGAEGVGEVEDFHKFVDCFFSVLRAELVFFSEQVVQLRQSQALASRREVNQNLQKKLFLHLGLVLVVVLENALEQVEDVARALDFVEDVSEENQAG